MIDEKNVFNQSVKNDLRTFESNQKIAISPGDDYTIGCLLDYIYFKNYYKMITINSSKTTSVWCWSKSNTTNLF